MNKTKFITKDFFLNSLVCPTKAWRTRDQEQEELSLGDEFRIKEGIKVGELARAVYPEGILIEEYDNLKAAEITKKYLDDPSVKVLFEATFVIGDFVTKADILIRNGDAWEMGEVKSSVNHHAEYIDDMAYTTMLLNKSGLKISSINLWLISGDYGAGDVTEKLFVQSEHTEEVLVRMNDFLQLEKTISNISNHDTVPQCKLMFECKKCDFQIDCHGEIKNNSIMILPRLSQKKFVELVSQDILNIEAIPEDYPLTAEQQKVVSTIKSGDIFVGDGLKNALEQIIFPAYYLDFETVMTGVPLFEGFSPHAQVPTQYSIHVCSAPNVVENHLEYLADPNEDFHRDFAETLLKDLGTEGSVITYSPFEKRILKEIGERFPDLAQKTSDVIARIIDLCEIIKNHFYHPDFFGSNSIKKTLPVLVPEMSYDDLVVGEGSSAMAAFADMVGKDKNDPEVKKMREALLTYCKQDTLAMVLIHKRLLEYLD